MMKKSEGKKRQSNNESENEEDCAADQCLKVFFKLIAHLSLVPVYLILFNIAYRQGSHLGAM
jgi:hypothetical protein